MKTRIPIIIALTGMLASGSCSEKEELPAEPVVAAFETPKQFYEMGEPIPFINKSKNAVAYKWTFVSDDTSIEENPVYTPQFYNFLGIRFPVLLEALGKDGTVSDTIQYITASRRIFTQIIITHMSDALMQSIPRETGKKTYIMFLFGPSHDPITLFSNYSSLIPSELPANLQLPFVYNRFRAHSVAMDNQPWIINIYAGVENQPEPLLLDSFYFVPTQQPAIQVKDKMHEFPLISDDISIVVEYRYI